MKRLIPDLKINPTAMDQRTNMNYMRANSSVALISYSRFNSVSKGVANRSALILIGILLSPVLAANPVVTAQNGLSCAGTRAGSNLGCSAGDFTTFVTLSSPTGESCTEGDDFYLDAQVQMTSGSPERYNIGFFTGEEANNPQTNDAAASCSVATFPLSPNPWFQKSDKNTCGDFRGSSTSTPTVRNLRVKCTSVSGDTLQVPYAITWEQNDNSACSGPTDIQPGTQSKCVGGTATISNVIVKPRPGAYYRFDEARWYGATGEVKDSGDNALHGVAQGGASTAGLLPAIAGDPGTCRYGVFDGQNDQVVIPHDNRLQGTSELTYAAWIWPNSWSGGIRQVMSKSVHGGGSGRAQMGIFSENNVLKGRAMALNGDSTSGWEVQAALPSLNTWTHVALVFAGNRLTLYVNGVEANSRTFAATTLRTNTDPFTVGNDHGRDYFFSGNIDEVRVYSTALTAAQVLAIRNETHPCPAIPVYSCAAVFPSPLQNSDLAGTISFGWNAQALSDPDGALETANLNFNSHGAATCGTAHCTAKGTASVPAELPAFPSNTSTTDVSTPLLGDTITLGQGGITDYRTITMNWRLLGSHLVDNGASTIYRIKTLNLNAGSVTLRGGADYWIETLNFNGSTTFNVTGTGTARLFVLNTVSASWGSALNPAGTANQLLFVPYGNVSWNTGSTVRALVYGNGNITFGSNMVLSGALASPGQITLESGTRITYDSDAIYTVDHRGLCPGGTGDVLNHIRIVHDGHALTCEPEQVTVLACKNTDCSERYTDTVSVTLSPAGWVGGDVISISGGTATAALRHTAAATVTLGATATTPTAASPTRCFSGSTESCALTFAEAGFVFDVPTLIANKTSGDVTVSAVKADPDDPLTCAPAFTGVRAVKWWSTYVNPNTGTAQLSVNGTTVSTESPGTDVDLTFDASAQAKITVRYPDAGLMQLNARYDGSGDETGLVMLGSDQFVAIPVGLCLESTDTNSACISGDHTCSAFTTAGTPFNLTLKAVGWESDTDTDLCTGNALTPNFRLADISLGNDLIAPAGGAAGSLSTGSFAFVAADNGSKTISQTISEVGVFRFTATPGTGAYFGETVAGGMSANIGRFIPDHFDVAHSATAACNGTFTYAGLGAPGSKAGQPFAVSGTITARNVTSGTTVNYQGGFAKLGTSDIGANPRQGAVAAAGSLSWSVDSLSFSNGVGDISVNAASYAFNAEGAPQNMHLRITATDSDGVTGTEDNDSKAIAYRVGRLRLHNSFGSELMAQDVPLQAETFTASGFYARDMDDGCTTLTLANHLRLSNDNGATWNNGDQAITVGGGTSTAEPSLSTLIGGDYGLSFSAPGAGNTGSIDIRTNISASHPWLLFDWDGNGTHDNEAQGRATFGIYKGSPRQIYLRERY